MDPPVNLSALLFDYEEPQGMFLTASGSVGRCAVLMIVEDEYKRCNNWADPDGKLSVLGYGCCEPCHWAMRDD